MAKKKHKKNKNKGASAPMAAGTGNGQGTGLFAGLTRMLPKGKTEQFLLGAAIGAAVAYVLADEKMRGGLMRSGLSLYSELAGGLAEFKEQMADIQAEMTAQQNGTL